MFTTVFKNEMVKMFTVFKKEVCVAFNSLSSPQTIKLRNNTVTARALYGTALK